MAKHSETSWKQDHPSTLLSNSVQKVNHAVKQAMSHPDEQVVEQAYNAISHAENALGNAEQYNEHMDIVQQNKEQLDLLKQQLSGVQDISEDLLQ
ncbi:MAG: hypothetical protein NAG76_05910 [Candidatus Pristimantibacillus lignocellulolyticus]|uniref:Uncharacterized protein n=1 Tax=Candidatus Pristimantibacillus lignocellulolyticus TaxID=2994561 RepID=A0A9J6ZHV5_9BACL|nr:MAG: hypothetical protein NAG76_05910 [Candidatus Pristimantibacillus lignocellulolyticus]